MKFYNFTYDYWLAESDPQAWFEAEVSEIKSQNEYGEFFKFISHSQLQNWKHQLVLYCKRKKAKIRQSTGLTTWCFPDIARL